MKQGPSSPALSDQEIIRAWKEETPSPWVFSRRTRKASPNIRTCTNRVRMVKYSPAASSRMTKI